MHYLLEKPVPSESLVLDRQDRKYMPSLHPMLIPIVPPHNSLSDNAPRQFGVGANLLRSLFERFVHYRHGVSSTKVLPLPDHITL